jgi:hypothetical protein
MPESLVERLLNPDSFSLPICISLTFYLEMRSEHESRNLLLGVRLRGAPFLYPLPFSLILFQVPQPLNVPAEAPKRVELHPLYMARRLSRFVARLGAVRRGDLPAGFALLYAARREAQLFQSNCFTTSLSGILS